MKERNYSSFSPEQFSSTLADFFTQIPRINATVLPQDLKEMSTMQIRYLGQEPNLRLRHSNPDAQPLEAKPEMIPELKKRVADFIARRRVKKARDGSNSLINNSNELEELLVHSYATDSLKSYIIYDYRQAFIQGKPIDGPSLRDYISPYLFRERNPELMQIEKTAYQDVFIKAVSTKPQSNEIDIFDELAIIWPREYYDKYGEEITK